MKYAIYGAGSLGIVLGAYLAKAGVDIELINRNKLMSVESAMPSNHLILCCPLLLLPAIFPSIWVFSN